MRNNKDEHCNLNTNIYYVNKLIKLINGNNSNGGYNNTDNSKILIV